MDKVYQGLEHAPALVAILAVTVAFLRFMKFMRESDDKRTAEFITAIRDINKENLEARHESKKVIEENTKAAALNTAAMTEMTGALRVMNRKQA